MVGQERRSLNNTRVIFVNSLVDRKSVGVDAIKFSCGVTFQLSVSMKLKADKTMRRPAKIMVATCFSILPVPGKGIALKIETITLVLNRIEVALHCQGTLPILDVRGKSKQRAAAGSGTTMRGINDKHIQITPINPEGETSQARNIMDGPRVD